MRDKLLCLGECVLGFLTGYSLIGFFAPIYLEPILLGTIIFLINWFIVELYYE